MNWGLQSSIFLRQLGNFKKAYLILEEKVSSAYLESFTQRLIRRIAKAIKLAVKYSIFGRLTELKEINSRDFFKTSKTIKILLNWIENLKNKVVNCSAASNFIIRVKDVKQDFCSRPVKVGGIIVTVVIMVNVLLSTILRKEVTLWGWLMRGIFLFVGIASLFCRADWPTVKSNSIILRKLGIH